MPEPTDDPIASRRRPDAGYREALERLHAGWLETELERADRLLVRGRLDAAEAASAGLYTAALQLRDRHWLAAVRAIQGRLDARRGRHRVAVARLLQALEHLERARHPGAFDRAGRDLGLCLRRAPTVKAAVATKLREIRRRRYLRGQVAWAQHRRLEGLVYLRRGRSEPAESALRGAARQLLKAGAARDAGLAVLDWGDLCAAEHDGHRALRLARKTLDALRSAEIERSAVAAFEAWVERLGDGGGTAGAGERARAAFLRMAAG